VQRILKGYSFKDEMVRAKIDHVDKVLSCTCKVTAVRENATGCPIPETQTRLVIQYVDDLHAP
jgi:hypothetical protein